MTDFATLFSPLLSQLTAAPPNGQGMSPTEASDFFNDVMNYINQSPKLLSQLNDLESNDWTVSSLDLSGVQTTTIQTITTIPTTERLQHEDRSK